MLGRAIAKACVEEKALSAGLAPRVYRGFLESQVRAGE